MATNQDVSNIHVDFIPNDLANYILASLEKINRIFENRCTAKFFKARDNKLRLLFGSQLDFSKAFEILNGHLRQDTHFSPVSVRPQPQSAEIELDEGSHQYTISHLGEINSLLLQKFGNQVRIEEGSESNNIKIFAPNNDEITNSFLYLRQELEKIHQKNLDNQTDESSIKPFQPIVSDAKVDIKWKELFIPEAFYENQIFGVKREIERRFRELVECLRERERKLLNELDAMLNTFKKARYKHKQTIIQLEQSLKLIQGKITVKSPKEIEDVITQQIESEREAFSSEFTGKCINIELDESVLHLAENLGRVVVTECSAEVSIQAVVGYKGRRTPVLSVGGRQSGEEGLLNRPEGVAVEYKTGNMFVADCNNHRVQVFDSNGKYLYKFGDEMSLPCYITIHQNRVFVSQGLTHCVSIYELNGTFLKQFGSYGSGESQFSCTRGIAISEINGDIYVCDCDNNRIQIFSKEFLFKSQFGQGTLRSPCYIKLTNELICVLSSSQPFLYSFSYNFTPTHNSVLSSISKHLKSPYSFYLDRFGHFIISDDGLNAVVIFSQQGELVHTITDSVQKPRGVALDSNGRIILVCENHRLLIF